MTRALAVLLVLSATVARADEAGDELARGKKLLKAGKTKEACEAFAAARAQAPTPEATAALADCDVQLGKLGAAWKLYTDAGDTAKAKAIARRAGKVTIEVHPADAKVRVFANGVDASAALAGAMPVDTGEVAIAASAPGYATFRTTVTIAEGADETVTVKLARKTDVAKLDPNDPDEPDAVIAHEAAARDRGGPPPAPPPANELRFGGELAYEFSPATDHVVLRFGWRYRELVEASVLAGARSTEAHVVQSYAQAHGAVGGGADVRVYVPVGNFCRPYLHGAAVGWSRDGFVAALGLGGQCGERTGTQLFLGFDQELAGDTARGVVVGVGRTISGF